MQALAAPFDILLTATQDATHLPEDERYSEAWHRWSDAERKAVLQAWASDRPLLVRGEAGSGKSQLARAVAKVFQVPLFSEVIHPRYEALDLLYREDPVQRLAHAQLLAALKPELPAGADLLAWLNGHLGSFVKPGPLWRAMETPAPECSAAPQWPRAVVLIDEIDKADSDLPNALLEVLGNRSFTVPATGKTVPFDPRHRPLIIITTNEDRELPPAFVRRCAVLNLRPDDATPEAFTTWLRERAGVHAALGPLSAGDPSPMALAAAQVWEDRQACGQLSLPTVGLAEYLDLLYSLLRLSAGDAARAAGLLDELSAFALVKHREQDQARAPRPRA